MKFPKSVVCKERGNYVTRWATQHYDQEEVAVWREALRKYLRVIVRVYKNLDEQNSESGLARLLLEEWLK